MPHVLVKLVQRKTEDQKNRLAEEITKNVMNILNYGEESVFRGVRRSRAAGLDGNGLQSRHSRQMEHDLQKTGIQPIRKVRNSL